MRTATKIKSWRKHKGLTQSELAKKIGVTQQTIASYESGAIKPPLAKITLLGAALGVPSFMLLEDEYDEVTSDVLGNIDRLQKELDFLSLCIKEALAEKEDHLLIFQPSIDNNAYSLAIDDINDMLDQCRQLYDFLTDKKKKLAFSKSGNVIKTHSPNEKI